nr:zinc finger, CCHC-type, retrotransposon Gag domain protein [Tanacetum cinerariifolium]
MMIPMPLPISTIRWIGGKLVCANWELRNDLHVCTFRACKELVSHLATPTEYVFLESLSNVELICRAYQTLGQSVVAHGELLKRHEELNHHYVDLRNRNDAQLEELDPLRPSLQRTTQENEDLNQRLTLLDSVHSECPSREKELLKRSLEKDLEPRTQQLVAVEKKIKVLEGEKLNLLGKAAQAEADRKKLVREFIHAMVKRLHTSSSGLRRFFRYAMLSIHSIYVMSLYPFTERYAQPYFFSCFIRQMVNTRTDADLSAAVQNALQTLLPQIPAEIREEFRTSSGPSDAGGNPLPVTIHTWLERFNKQKPHSFEKATAPVDAENWISHMEKIFDVMGCEDAFKTRLAVYKFEGNALAWWKAYKQAKGGDAWLITVTWADFK